MANELQFIFGGGFILACRFVNNLMGVDIKGKINGYAALDIYSHFYITSLDFVTFLFRKKFQSKRRIFYETL